MVCSKTRSDIEKENMKLEGIERKASGKRSYKLGIIGKSKETYWNNSGDVWATYGEHALK